MESQSNPPQSNLTGRQEEVVREPTSPLQRPAFPNSQQDQKTLQQRAQKLAHHQTNQKDDHDAVLFIQFQLSKDDYYGIPYHYADSIIPCSGLTPVPHTPGFIAGVIHRRGELLTVIDLNPFFAKPAHNLQSDTQIVVIQAAGMTVGILTDHIDGNDRYSPKQLTSTLRSTDGAGQEFVEGIHQGKVAILNLERFLSNPSLAVGKQQPYGKRNKITTST